MIEHYDIFLSIELIPPSGIRFDCLISMCRNDFKDFVEICFQEFGDRVKHWVTFNEPFSYCLSTSHRYKATHNQLLSHAAVVELYKTKNKV
jgi:beta-glucosidase/6-phospho-beta-glucosidase/beta-galactosidase